MTTINFTYNNKNTIIQCKDEDNIKEIFERFCMKAGLDINSVYFLYDGNSLNNNLSVSQVACKRDKLTKSMNILDNSIYGFKELAGAKIYLLPHQVNSIMRCLQEEPCRYMLADEVGMGKTIEAISVFNASL